jgi:hypothetical protein
MCKVLPIPTVGRPIDRFRNSMSASLLHADRTWPLQTKQTARSIYQKKKQHNFIARCLDVLCNLNIHIVLSTLY